MKSRFASAILLICLSLIIGATIVFADGFKGWSPIKTTGYAVISNFQGIDVSPGQEIVVTAGTTDLTITSIVFRWEDPNNNTVWEDNVPVSGPITTPTVPSNVHQEVIDWANTNTGVQYLYAQNTHTPNIIGDWGVHAYFIGSDGKPRAGLEDVVQIRSTSFNVIPEAYLGTIGIVAAMLGAFGFFAFRKRKFPFSI